MAQTTVSAGDIGLEILADCLQDISAASHTVFQVKTPLGATMTWPASTATVDGETHYLRYVTVAGDLAESGIYKIQPHFTLGDWTGCGRAGCLEVKPLYA